MLITDRDKEIIDFIYDIGFSSIKTISDMFFNDCRYGYDLARKRLKKIYDVGGYIKKFNNSETCEIIYVPENSKLKKVSMHNMKILDYICKIRCLGCNIKEVEFEPVFDNIKPDAILKFEFNGYEYFQILEVQLRHDFVNLKRYESNDVINAIVSKTSGILPKLIIVQNTGRDYSKENNTQFDIAQLDIKMNDIAKVLI